MNYTDFLQSKQAKSADAGFEVGVEINKSLLKHLGDITKINGAEVEPVWVIIGGFPLTLDEMNALDHEPIYILHTGGKWTMNGWHIATASSYQNHGRCDLEIDNGNTIIDTQNYGKTWLAYRYKPEEVQA